MPKIDADLLRLAKERSMGEGLGWCEKQGVERVDLIALAAEMAGIAAKEDVGMTSYGVAMFKLGYEARHAQEIEEIMDGGEKL